MKALFALVIAASVTVAFAAVPQPAENLKALEDPQDFAGKVLLVHTGDGSYPYPSMLTDAKIVQIGEKEFLAGKGFSDERDYRSGKRVVVALDHVISFIEFTPEEFEQVRQRFQNRGANPMQAPM